MIWLEKTNKQTFSFLSPCRLLFRFRAFCFPHWTWKVCRHRNAAKWIQMFLSHHWKMWTNKMKPFLWLDDRLWVSVIVSDDRSVAFRKQKPCPKRLLMFTFMLHSCCENNPERWGPLTFDVKADESLTLGSNDDCLLAISAKCLCSLRHTFISPNLNRQYGIELWTSNIWLWPKWQSWPLLKFVSDSTPVYTDGQIWWFYDIPFV